MSTDIYLELLTTIVKRFNALMGAGAIRLARKVYGLKVNDDGTVVSFSGEGKIILQGLAIEYMTLLGPEALALCRRAISPIVERSPGIELPPILH